MKEIKCFGECAIKYMTVLIILLGICKKHGFFIIKLTTNIKDSVWMITERPKALLNEWRGITQAKKNAF